MTKRMIVIMIAIAAIMLFLVIPELITGMSILDAFLSSMGVNVSITVDATPPYVEIIIPEPITYPTETITLQYNITDTLSPINTIWYNIDNGTNVTITSFVLITIPAGEHILYLYANDTAGNTNFSYVNFSTTKPVEPPGGEEGGGGAGGGGVFEEPKNITLPGEKPAEVPPEVPPVEVPGEIPREALYSDYSYWYFLIIIMLIVFLALYIRRRKDKKRALVKKRKDILIMLKRRRKKTESK